MGCPSRKDYDFGFQPSVSEQQMRELVSLGFLKKSENVVFFDQTEDAMML